MLRARGHAFQLPTCMYNLHKKSFVISCLFKFLARQKINFRGAKCWNHIISWSNAHGTHCQNQYTTVYTSRKNSIATWQIWEILSVSQLLLCNFSHMCGLLSCLTATLFIDRMAILLCACFTLRLWIMRLNYSCKSRAQKEHHEEQITNTMLRSFTVSKHIVQV